MAPPPLLLTEAPGKNLRETPESLYTFADKPPPPPKETGLHGTKRCLAKQSWLAGTRICFEKLVGVDGEGFARRGTRLAGQGGFAVPPSPPHSRGWRGKGASCGGEKCSGSASSQRLACNPPLKMKGTHELQTGPARKTRVASCTHSRTRDSGVAPAPRRRPPPIESLQHKNPDHCLLILLNRQAKPSQAKSRFGHSEAPGKQLRAKGRNLWPIFGWNVVAVSPTCATVQAQNKPDPLRGILKWGSSGIKWGILKGGGLLGHPRLTLCISKKKQSLERHKSGEIDR